MKQCIKCKKPKPETEEFFYFRKDQNKFINTCRKCVKNFKKEHESKPEIKERIRKYDSKPEIKKSARKRNREKYGKVTLVPMQQELHNILDSKGLIFEKDYDREWSFLDLLSDLECELAFDCIIFKKGTEEPLLLIECDEKKHNWNEINNSNKYDQLKNEYCKNNNYQLLRIKKEDNMKEIVNNFVTSK